MRGWKWMCAVAAATTMFAVLEPAPAAACSIAATTWDLVQSDGLNAPAAGPFVAIVQGYGGFDGELPPLDGAAFDVTVTDREGNLVEGEHTLIREGESSVARLAWTPAEPLEEGGTFQMLVINDAAEFGTATELTLVPGALEATPPSITLSAMEIEVEGGERQCCEKDLDENPACFMDTCGDETFDSCRICWNTAYEYPVQVQLDWQVEGDLPSNYFGYRISEMDEIDEVIRVLAEGDLANSSVSFRLPDDADDGLVGIRLELVDLATETAPRPSETAFLIELDGEDDVVRLAHRAPNNRAATSECAAGTTVEVGPDGNETPISDPDPDDFMDECMEANNCDLDGFMLEEDEGTSKKQAGGCSAVDGDASLGALLLGMVLGLRRRRQ